MFSTSSLVGVMEAKQALYTLFALPIYTLDVAGFTVVLAIFDFEDAVYTSQKAYFSIKWFVKTSLGLITRDSPSNNSVHGV